MTSYAVKPDQSLFDIAIEVYGDVDGVFWILEDNPALMGMTDRLQAGQTLLIRDAQLNPRQVSALKDFGPFQTLYSEPDKASGIDFWRLEDYIIS